MDLQSVKVAPQHRQTAAMDTPDLPLFRDPGWQLLYFEAPTRGEQVRLLFKAVGVEFTDVRLEYPQGLTMYKHSALGLSSPLLFDQCPTVRSPEGHFVSQTAAIMQYVGRSNNFAPEGVADDALALSLTMGSEDVRNKVWYKLMVPSVLYYVLGKKFGGLLCFLRPVVSWWFGNKKVAATLPKHLAHFENHLAKRGSDYFVGSQPCYADIAIFDCIRETLALPAISREGVLLACPKLNAWLGRMEDNASLKAHLVERGHAINVIAAGFGG
mmetsp:Transcript_19692/g.51599  ORF Transcript_19692/g.51599 Transcript_19692/m.51599 type:complete len:270 (-) Transcript_19692:575-1384(-)